MTTVAGNVRLTRHIPDLDDDGHDIHGTPVVTYAECNTSPTGSVAVPFDTFYDVDAGDLSGVLPTDLGLAYSGGNFTASEDGLWTVGFGCQLVAAPGSVGTLGLTWSGYGYGPILNVAASGNPSEATWERTIPLRSGQVFYVDQVATGGVALINGYALLTIIRIARTVA